MCAWLFSAGAHAQNVEAYRLFTGKGKKTTFEKMARDASKAQVVLFGEYHDDAIGHWMQLKLAQDLHRRGNLVMGAEMFERDTQHLLNAYLAGELEDKEFRDTVHSIWSNYATDYKPLVDFAREQNVPFLATNVPRYMASAVYRGGFEKLEELSDDEKAWLPPLPPPYDASLPGYQAMLEMGMGHGGDNFPKAQAIKDATMGWFIVQNLPDEGVFLHFNGSYHSNNYEGIYWYLNQYATDLNIFTITTVRQEDVSKLLPENRGLADFILVVDEDMTRTYR